MYILLFLAFSQKTKLPDYYLVDLTEINYIPFLFNPKRLIAAIFYNNEKNTYYGLYNSLKTEFYILYKYDSITPIKYSSLQRHIPFLRYIENALPIFVIYSNKEIIINQNNDINIDEEDIYDYEIINKFKKYYLPDYVTPQIIINEMPFLSGDIVKKYS